MNFWQSLTGTVRVQLVSADITAVMSAINAAGIHLQDVNCIDILTTDFTIPRKDWHRVRRIAARRDDSIRVIRRDGSYWLVKGLLKRPVLVLGVLILLTVSLYLPTRVLFIQVEGNSIVPTNQILEKAAQCGISFGTSRRTVRSEKMKNALLEAMPELQWAGINTKGCVAVITVHEKLKGEQIQNSDGFSSLIASRDGIIQECTATSGTALCKPGQAVQAGQVLISGLVDTGLTVRLCRAEGEVYAITERIWEVLLPVRYSIRQEKTITTEKYALLIGKKRINFYKGSGISGVTCVRMYSEKYMTLPGGFRLPLALIHETWIEHSQQEQETPLLESQSEAVAAELLRQQLGSGRILSGAGSEATLDDFVIFSGKYQCYEQISVRKNEEIVQPDE